MVVKLVTPGDERDTRRNENIDRIIAKLQELRNENKIAGFAMVTLLKDGSNWTHQTSLDDCLKMIGAVELLKTEVMNDYFEDSLKS